MAEVKPQPDPSPVPLVLLSQILRLKDTLIRNGTVQCRRDRDRHPSYRLRFRYSTASDDVRRHRSIALPDEQAARAIRGLLTLWRLEQSETVEAKRKAEAERRAQKQRVRETRKTIQDAGGGGRRRRKRNGAEYMAFVQQGPWAEFLYMQSEMFRRPNQRPGKPSRKGLVLPFFGAQRP